MAAAFYLYLRHLKLRAPLRVSNPAEPARAGCQGPPGRLYRDRERLENFRRADYGAGAPAGW